jgi:hypothetical protein
MYHVDIQKVRKVGWTLENNPIYVIRSQILDKYFKTELSIDLLVSNKLCSINLVQFRNKFGFYYR